MAVTSSDARPSSAPFGAGSLGLTGALVVGCACAVAAWLWPSTVAYSNGVFAALILSAIILTVVIARYFQTGRDMFDPLILFSLALMFYFGLHTIWVAGNPTSVEQHYLHGFAAGLGPALGLLSIGYIAALVGFVMVPPRPKREATRTYTPRALFLTYALGITGSLLGASAGAYSKGTAAASNAGAPSNIPTYTTLSFVAVIALVVCTCQHYELGGKVSSYRNLMWLMLGSQVVLGFAVAQKSIAFFALFAWLAARNTYVRVKPRQVAVFAVLAVFVIAPVIQASRGAGAATNGAQNSLGSVGQTASSVPQRLGKYFTSFPNEALTGWDIVNFRTDGAESLAAAYLFTPSYQGYQYGRHWPDVLVTLVPHVLWPGKPAVTSTALNFSEVYAGEATTSGAGLSVSPTLPGDLYMNFGWVGIIIGFFVLGVILKVICNVRQRFSAGVSAALLVSTMLALVLLEQGVVGIGSQLIFKVLGMAGAFMALRIASGPRGTFLGTR